MHCRHIGNIPYAFRATSQIREKAEGLLNAVITENKTNDIPADSSAAIEDKLRLDSIRMQELELQLQEMKLNEIVLRTELSDALNKHITTDSLKKKNSAAASTRYGR